MIQKLVFLLFDHLKFEGTTSHESGIVNYYLMVFSMNSTELKVENGGEEEEEDDDVDDEEDENQEVVTEEEEEDEEGEEGDDQ